MPRLNILPKLLFFLCLAFFISFGSIFLIYQFEFSNYSKYVQSKALELLTNKYKYSLMNATEVGSTLLNAIMALRGFSEEEKLNIARELIRPLRFGNEGYYFVYERGTGINVIHGSDQEFEGKNLWDMQDPDKTEYIIRELDRVAQNGTGFHEYKWTKIGSTALFLKLGTAMMVPNTRYWIGTGEYIDDINTDKNALMAEIAKITDQTRMKVLISLAVLSVIVVIVIILLAQHLTKPIKHLIQSTKKISEGNYDISLRIISHDEIGELASLFNSMAKSLKDYTENLEKKVSDRTVELQDALSKLNETNSILAGLSEKLSRYLPPQIKESILSGKHETKISSKRKKLTVFFSDIKNFTQTTSRMETEALTDILNTYLDEMAKIAIKFGGTVDKYIGDAIMIFFGDPDTKGIREDAVACISMAIEMRKRNRELRERWLTQGVSEPFHVRMGINTGYCTVGNFGSLNRMDYTIIGSQVNLASRLENAAGMDQILISHETFALVTETVFCRKKEIINVKGIEYPVQTYEVVDYHANIPERERHIEEDIQGFKVVADLGQVTKENKKKILEALKKTFDAVKGV